jgi:hypothetical protein
MTDNARSRVGSPYQKRGSFHLFLFRDYDAENCVSLVRKSFGYGYRYDPGWVFPDSVVKDRSLGPVWSKGIERPN